MMECLIAGVDEAGRGPLAGPVVAAAVILDPDRPVAGIADSKALSAQKRTALAVQIRRQARFWSVGQASVAEIDELNILQATMLAMQRAVASLSVVPGLVKVDGNRCPKLPCAAEAIIKGDRDVMEIGAASILAKVVRDEEMLRLDALYPHYGFARHKGYPTRDHLLSLRRHGVSPVHRRSFAPVRDLLAAGQCLG